MKFDLEFQESSQSFDVGFGEIHDLSDGGYERGYEAGYEVGCADGYTQGHTEGVENGKEIGYNDGMDAIINKTLVSYSNDTIKTLPVAYFSNCVTLEYISLPAVTHLSGFQGCTALKSCNFAGAQYVQSGAFKGCTSLQELSFPSAEQIHASAFEGCTSLVRLILEKNKIPSLSNVNSFAGTPIEAGTGYVYVSDNLVERYKTAANWSAYASQIKPLSELPE